VQPGIFSLSRACGLSLAVLDGGLDAVAALVELQHPSAGHDLDALPLKAFAGKGRDLRVFYGEDLRQHLHNRDLGAQCTEERGKLDADGP